jgi:hypothetical protein
LTAFVTWLKTFTARSGLLAAGPVLPALALLASGCGLLGRSPKPELPPGPPAEPAAAQTAPAPLAGLTPLPSANALLASVAIGREDPLAPQVPVPRSAGSGTRPPAAQTPPGAPAATPPGAPAATRPVAPARLELPDDFRFSGVLRAGSTPQAFVEVGDQSGPVCPGADGSCPASGLPTVLPKGWGVAAIDVERGRLTLRKGSRTVTAQL